MLTFEQEIDLIFKLNGKVTLISNVVSLGLPLKQFRIRSQRDKSKSMCKDLILLREAVSY